MEILLIAACAWLVHTAGAQSEQSKMGLSPAQRDIMREKTRHEKAVRKISEKHGGTAPPKNGVSPWKDASAAGGAVSSTPETFWSGYRNQRPARPPLGHRAGAWAGSGVTWAQGTGRGAWQAYRKRRKDAGHDDPGPVRVPQPPQQPPLVPPIPAHPPTVGVDSDKNKVADLKKAPEAVPDGADKPTADAAPTTAQPDTTTPEPQPAATQGGTGRMAAEVTYESVMDESDELSAMCEDDGLVYNRIRDRAEREIGRGDDLIAALQDTGFGSKVIGWAARCKENYGVILSEVGTLQQNTIAQGEAVVKAKALLEAGQGVYADIAKDMEDVAERESYISDAVDAGDVFAHGEVTEGGGL